MASIVSVDAVAAHPTGRRLNVGVTGGGDASDRNVVERAFNQLKNWRGLVTRYDKHVLTYRGGVVLAAALLRLDDQQTVP